MGDLTWFDGVTPCPDCAHTCFDHCVCRTADGVDLIDPPCLCDDEAHISGKVNRSTCEPFRFSYISCWYSFNALSHGPHKASPLRW